MPCMGPGEPTADEVEKVTQDVLEFLRTKHNLLPEKTTAWVSNTRPKVIEQLRTAIKEVIFQQYCEEF